MLALDDVQSWPIAAQVEYCDPKRNPDGAAFFITNFCHTFDEDAGGATRLIPKKWFVLKVIRTIDFKDFDTLEDLDPANIHMKKSRRMIITWIVAGYNIYKLSFDAGYSARFISSSEDLVDDGGINATVDSFFGRMRYIHDRLPEHVRRPIDFARGRARSLWSDGYITGRAPTVDSGRGTGQVRLFWDEHAFTQNAEQIHAAADPACRFGKVYFGTVNGEDNLFARIDKEQPAGWRFVDVGWDMDPDHTADIRDTEPGPERDRYGPRVSSWLISVTASFTDEVIGSEYGRRYEKSTVGRILREFNKEIHVRKSDDKRGRLLYDPSLELRIGLDPGHARKCAALLTQPVANERLRVISAFEGMQKNAGENAKDLVAHIRSVGYVGDLQEIVMVPDPAAFNEELGTGLELYAWFRSVGLTQYVWPLIVGPDSVYLGNNVVRVMLQRGLIEVDEIGGKLFINAVPGYKLPVDRKTMQITSNKPIPNMSTHLCDTLRYVVTSIWTADDFLWVPTSDLLGPARALKGETGLLHAARLDRPRVERDPGADPDDMDEVDPLGGRMISTSLSGRRF